jgi:DNA-binding LacI/PurR family transcriptional regulator
MVDNDGGGGWLGHDRSVSRLFSIEANMVERAAVMADVARAAGVSKQTVSRVLNNVPVVNEVTRERVLVAMRELGYQPNPVARALATGRTGVLGVLAFDTVRYGPATVLQGIHQAATEAGYLVSVAPLRAHDRGVDGLITFAPQPDLGLPIVTINGGLDQAGSVVAVDEAGGACAAAEHLLGLGHRTVHHIAGPPSSPAARERTRGWREALVDAGREVPEALTGDWDAGSGFALGSLLAGDPAVTAIFAANDQMAVGVLRALHEHGRSVPGDVCVIGFDDIPESAHLIPPLSTVRPDFAATGRQCVTMLLDQFRAGAPRQPRRVVMPADLVLRESTGKPPGAVFSRS